MTQMSGGRALVEMLRRYDVDTLFALPGYQNDHFFNALYDARGTPSEIRVIHTRHEQGAAYMAYGYAKSSGRVGAFAVVPGPGMLNTTAALSTAYAASTPVLCISGQIPSTDIGRGFGRLHEIPDSLAVLRSLTKWAVRAEHPTEIPGLVAEAFRQMRTGRPRPVALEVPMDVLGMRADIALTDPPAVYDRPAPDGNAIAEAAQLLAAASHPLIMIGGGADDAGEELRAIAELLQAPVVASSNGRGVLSEKHYLSLPGPGGHRLWGAADVVLAVGTRLQPPLQMWGTDAALKIIRIDVDPQEMRRIQAPAIGIVADAKAALAALHGELAQRVTAPRASRQQELGALKEELDEAFSQVQPQYDYLRAIRGVLPENGVFVEDLTQVGYSARYAFPSYQPRTHVTSNYQGTLGYGFGAALGVKVANPDRPVLCVNGDGGFMYNVQELATAVQHEIGVVVAVFNDGAFGNVQRMQREDYQGRVIASDLRNPDFVRLAEAYGAAGVRANGPAELAAAIREGFTRRGPTLIEIPVGVMSEPWRHILMPRVRGGGARP